MKHFKLLSIPITVMAILMGSFWMFTNDASADPDTPLIAPPGPICRNGASGSSPDFGLAYASTGEGGMDLSFNVEFVPRIRTYSEQDGYVESVGNIRFKPKFDANGQRIVDEYWLAGANNDLPFYDDKQRYPYFSEPEDAPYPYSENTRWAKGLGPTIRANPGKIWVVGNEVDRKDSQDSLLPETYARAYHDAYSYIKGIDPTAQIAISGLVNFGPDREQYLTNVFTSYRAIYGYDMPVDIFTMHVYNIWGRHYDNFNPNSNDGSYVALGSDPELTWRKPIFFDPATGQERFDANLCDISTVICVKEHDDVQLFQQQVIGMRQWMKDNGYKEKPLILREWGLNLTSDFCDEDSNRITAQRAANYLTTTINWMNAYTDPSLGYSLDENRLVQRWAWFVINENVVTLPYIADISHLITDYTINYPECGSPAFPSKIPNAGNQNQLTVVGQAYRDVVAAQQATNPPTVDFMVENATIGTAIQNNANDTVTTKIGVMVRNMGNSPTGQATTVEFRDASDNSLIGTYEIPPNFQGCTTALHHATVDWTHSTTGTFNFTVDVVSSEEAPSATGNNTGSGFAFVGSEGVYLPVTRK